MSFIITGTGSSLPEYAMTNDDFCGFLETSDEWIKTRTGISKRHILKSEKLTDIAVKAANLALENAGAAPSEIDLLICTTLQGDYISPSMSCLVAKKLGLTLSRVFDVNMGCSGFVFALDMAKAYFESGRAHKALIVSAESMSRLIDWRDRKTCVLFGDGAGAVVLEKGEGISEIELTVDGAEENLNIPGTFGNFPFEDRPRVESALYMNGKEIYKFAVSSIVRDIEGILYREGMTPDDIAFFLLHQANIRILESAREKLGQSPEKFPYNMDLCGNTSSASIPMLLDKIHREGRLKKGDKIVLSTFGAGLSSGACIIEWVK